MRPLRIRQAVEVDGQVTVVVDGQKVELGRMFAELAREIGPDAMSRAIGRAKTPEGQ